MVVFQVHHFNVVHERSSQRNVIWHFNFNRGFLGSSWVENRNSDLVQGMLMASWPVEEAAGSSSHLASVAITTR